ncbi:multidrug resistance efflux pump [Anaerosolibacter carboniphilus]|uniref:Multidrug resistance efflux pump n=1 Tax=Anaerosolibacter carboniphilus TaxID=1417629 RepID=A0A841KYA7_9FIRM|nr:HlyD family efflux transporter periplasmic adaptor subunit [Anaerosolibacter carboniphilus]MBB6218756.1 multidrug resistance efflux pump [Anaerosolibacter carboniphilus]
MRTRIAVLWMILILILTTGCSIGGEDKESTPKAKPVKVMAIKEEIKAVVLDYTGIVGSEDLKKLAFKSGGKIEKVLVKEGEKIQAGQPLIQLDMQDLKYNLAASQGQLDAAKAQYDKAMNGAMAEDIKQAEASVEKAEAAYNFTMDQYEKMEKLYDAGAISKNDLEKAKLELDTRKADFNAAKEIEKKTKNGSRSEDKAAVKGQMEQAAADYQYKLGLVEDAVIKSNGDGYVVDVLYEEGEMVGAGYPVIVIRNNEKILKVGMSSKDLSKVRIGTKTKVRVNDEELEGVVTNIGQTPEEETLTYPIEIALSRNNWPIGSVGKVELVIGEVKGIWIPISAILSNGEDYVFVMKDGKAQQRKIKLREVQENYVRVEGLSPNEKLIVEGMKKLKDQELVSVQK